MKGSIQRKPAPIRHPFVKDLVAIDPNWANYCTHEDILRFSTMYLHDFFYEDEGSVLKTLEEHFTSMGAAEIAIKATQFTIRQLENYGADINSDLTRAMLKRAVTYAVEIVALMCGEPFNEAQFPPESYRFRERRILNIAEKEFK